MPEMVDMEPEPEPEPEPEAAAALVALGTEPSPSKLGEHIPSIHTSVGFCPIIFRRIAICSN